MPVPERRHIVIAGTGRAGTTLLVQLLARCGLDVGHEADSGLIYDPAARAGLEMSPTDDRAPHVVKSPAIASLDELAHDGFDPQRIERLVIPVRELSQVVASRKLRSASSLDPHLRGGLVESGNPFRQRSILAVRFHRLVESAVRRDVPMTFVAFPRFAIEKEYAIRKVGEISGASEAEIAAAWDETVNPDFVSETGLRTSWTTDVRLLVRWAVVVARARWRSR